MIGTLNWDKKEAIVVGAGISGLLIGYRLKQLGFQVQIHEASSRVGGLIQTLQTPYGPAEMAAHSLLVSPTLEPFFRELQVPLQPVNPESRSRYIVRNGRMRRFPLSFCEAIALIFNLFKSRPKLNPDTTSLKEWCEYYLGKPAHDYLFSPFVTGVFACSPARLNAKLAFAKLFPTQDGSLYQHIRRMKHGQPSGRPKMMTPTLGMQSLVEALARELNAEIHLNSKMSDLPKSPNVIYSVPTLALADLIQNQDPKSSELLRTLSYSPLITVTAFFDQKAFPQRTPPRGVGVLIPRSESYRMLGVLFNSSAFENRVNSEEFVSMTYMFGGTEDPTALELSDVEIEKIITEESERLFYTKQKPLHLEISRWDKAIPLYSNQLNEILRSLEMGLCAVSGNIVMSNYSGQVSIRGMIETLYDPKILMRRA